MTILFDLDGTLIDSTEAILESFHVAMQAHELSGVDDAMIKAQIGYPLDLMFVNLGFDPRKKWDYVNSYKMHYREISRAKTVLLPGAIKAVELAASFANLGVVTTKTGRYSKELLEHMNIMHYFNVLIGREDVEQPKPHAEPILTALHAMQVQPSQEVYMIGDTKLDMQAAKNAQITPVAVDCGYDDKSVLLQYCSQTYNSALCAVEAIKNNNV